MYQYHANTMRELHIGRQGENAVRQVLFDISDWSAELGPGTSELIYQRSGREDPYPVIVERDGNTIIWTITERETECPYRNGRCELRYYVADRDGVAKSRVWTTFVEPSISTPSGDPPEEERGWFDQVIAAGAEAKSYAESAKSDADRAETAAVRQPYPDAQTGTWWVWDAASGAYVDSGVSFGKELLEQIRHDVGDLSDLTTTDKSSLVAAINEIIQTGISGGVDPADIAKAVADYMAAHPIQETDPTVPEWAKRPEKPTYTASEVGALPDTYTPTVDASLSETSTNPVQNKIVAAKLSEVESIAKGRATGHVFETETDMRTWIAANASALTLGDNLYIRATDVPDYWWDGTSAQPLETQKIDLTEYAKKSEVPAVDPTLTQSGQAADAAAVGQELSSLSGKIAEIPSGKDGADGQDGITPTIGDNGNWYLGDTDTGKPSRGEPGQDGADGKDGAPGASGADGYTPIKGTDYFTDADKQEIAESAAGMVSIPTALPNPNALTFTGAVTGSYDGSAPLTVEIPSGGGSGEGGSVGFEVLVDFTTEEAVTEFTIPETVITPIISKIKDASILMMQINIPRDGTDTSITTTGTVNIKAFVGWLTDIVGRGFNAIIAPSETSNKNWTKNLLVTKAPESVMTNTNVCLIQIFGKRNNSNEDSVVQQTYTNYFNNFYERTYITVVGSQTMAAGTRFVLGVIA